MGSFTWKREGKVRKGFSVHLRANLKERLQGSFMWKHDGKLQRSVSWKQEGMVSGFIYMGT